MPAWPRKLWNESEARLFEANVAPLNDALERSWQSLQDQAPGLATDIVQSATSAAQSVLPDPSSIFGGQTQQAPQNGPQQPQASRWSLPDPTSLFRAPEPVPTPSGTPSAMPSAAPSTIEATIQDGRVTPPTSGGDWRSMPVQRPMGEIVEGDPQGFFNSAGAYADAVERETGVPAALSMAIAANETGYGQRRYMAGSNNYHGIQAQPGEAGAVPYRDWRPDGAGGQQFYDAAQRSFADPLAGFHGFASFLRDNPRYGPALQRYQQTGDVEQLARDIHAAGYAEDPEWSNKVISIMRGIPVRTGVGEVEAGAGVSPQSRIPGPEQTAGGTPYSAGSYTPNQIDAATAEGLDYETALAVCGPAAAIAFARRHGRNPTMQEAVTLAKQVGWTPEQGMAGPASQQRLLQSMGIAARLVDGSPDWQAVAADVQRGNPVTISTPGHYFVAERYDPQSGAFDFGESARVLKASGGRRWFRPDELANLGMGEARASLFIDNPESPTPSIVADPRQSSLNTVGAVSSSLPPAAGPAAGPPAGGGAGSLPPEVAARWRAMYGREPDEAEVAELMGFLA